MRKQPETLLILLVLGLLTAICTVPAGALIDSFPGNDDNDYHQSGEPNASIPPLINYQGYLTDPSDNPLTGTFDIIFALYDDPSDTDAKWSEERLNISVNEGLFNIILGQQKPIEADVLNGNTYLGITVDHNAEMAPRQRLTSVAYAILSDQSNNSNWLDGMDSDDFVHSSGYTMWGTLELPADGLTAGTDQLVLHNGNVGIGTSNPAFMLDVKGNVVFSGDSFRVEGDDDENLLYIDTALNAVGMGVKPQDNTRLTVEGKVVAQALSGDGGLITDFLPNKSNITVIGTWYSDNQDDSFFDMRLTGITEMSPMCVGCEGKHLVMPYSGSIIGITIVSNGTGVHGVHVAPTINGQHYKHLMTAQMEPHQGIPVNSGRATQPSGIISFTAGDRIGVMAGGVTSNSGPFLASVVVRFNYE
ncbi:MAG: hypothetical protein GY845_13725 [Planctomycetes bacterium]|nr:hypothetical protein [Planctomycetota bacterium]